MRDEMVNSIASLIAFATGFGMGLGGRGALVRRKSQNVGFYE